MNRSSVEVEVEGLRERGSAGSTGALREGQLWLLRAVTRPEHEPQPFGEEEARAVLTSGPRLGALDRLEIYRRGYHARLVECLADDYAVLAHALGPAPFEDLSRAYIARHPSGSPNLNWFGRRMAAFCRDEAPEPFPQRAFAVDLASLEWAMVEVIHAPSSEAMTLERLGAMPIEAWASARLIPNAALRVLRFAYPVNAYLQGVRDEADPPIPAPSPAATAVYRSGPTVWRMDLTATMFDVLTALVAGQSLSESLSRAEPAFASVDEEEASRRVLGWFRDWVESGLFADVALGPV